jgi:hypothetical protein
MSKINLGHDQSPPGDCSKNAGEPSVNSDNLQSRPLTGSHSDNASEITLNYAFAPPSGGNLSPLPLNISKRLLDGPSATLRPIIIDALGAEGITVRLGDIRFWRVRQIHDLWLARISVLIQAQTSVPLEGRIAVNGIKGWIQELPSGERVPVGIPFTDSISEALGEWVSNNRLVHLVVTGGDTPFSVESELSKSESPPGPPQVTVSTTLSQ